MTSSRITPVLWATLLSAALLLSACGGSSDGDAAAAPAAAASAPTASSAFAACFEITPGVAYTTTDPGGTPDGVLLTREAFEGSVRNTGVEFVDATQVRSVATYWSREANGIRLWGDVDYDNAGTAERKAVFSDGALLPLAPQVGQAIPLSYTITVTPLSPSAGTQVLTQPVQETWTFEGLETLTLGGRTFADACRLRRLDANAAATGDGPSTLWFAKGFGNIRSRHTDSSGAVLEETELLTLTAAP